jgi:hypothetical protein
LGPYRSCHPQQHEAADETLAYMPENRGRLPAKRPGKGSNGRFVVQGAWKIRVGPK